MENTTVTIIDKPVERKNSNGWKYLAGVVLLFSTIACVAATFLGVAIYKDSTRKTNESEETKTTNEIKDFTSNVVFQPSGTVIDLINKTSPAVVTVVSKTQVNSLYEDDPQEVEQGVGTGFFVSDDGLLITNEHVVCGSSKPDNLTIVTSDNKSYGVKSFVVDPVQDIAIVQVDLKNDKVSYLKFANKESKVVVGEEVIAIGNPLGVNPGTVTRGIISGINRNISARGACQSQMTQKDYEAVLQTDAAINSGNSGGPLINLNGEVVGVNSATSIGANNISYSVPFDRVVRLLERYQKNNGKLTFPLLGVKHVIIDPNLAKSRDIPQGALVQSVVAGSPADIAGIRKGDIITKIEDKKIEFSLQAVLNQYFEPNEKVKVEIYRPARSPQLDDENVTLDGKTLTLNVTIGEK